MKIPFEELETNPDKKLSFVEKSIIAAASLFIKALLWKAGRAKTYGDLTKLGALIDDNVEDVMFNIENKRNYTFGHAAKDIAKTAKAIKNS